MNRSAAIQALVERQDTAQGLEADALLLHFRGEQGANDVDFEGARYLYRMAEFGSETAQRVLRILLLDDIWAETYGRPNDKDFLG